MTADNSKRRSLNPEQEFAAHLLDKHVSVTAGPGSGKTTVLVERYLTILRKQGVSVDQVVAITFTNRAANEMRTRLRREIDSLLADAPSEERRMWLRNKRTLESAVITTIHGLCSRLLREFPLEAGIDPQFVLLDEHQAAMLEATIGEEVISRMVQSGDEQLSQLMLSHGREGFGQDVLRVYRSVRGAGISFANIRSATARTHATETEYRNCLGEIDGLINEFISMPKLSKVADQKRRDASQLWPAFRKSLENLPPLTEFNEFQESIIEFRSVARPVAAGQLKELVQSIDEMFWDNKSLGRLSQTCVDTYATVFAETLIDLLEKIETRLSEEKTRLSALSFDDLEIKTLEMLRTRPDVGNRIADRYRYFLIDEFQDTNASQQELVNLLAFGGGKSNLFIVGDPKQSIYGFRGADVNVFTEVTDRILDATGVIAPLSSNYRSHPQLVSFFNQIFEQIFKIEEADPEEIAGLGYVKHEHSVAKRTDDGEHPAVELLIDVRPSKPSDNDANWASTREGDAKQIAERILQLVEKGHVPPDSSADLVPTTREFRFADVALLFRALTQVAVYEDALRHAGIPYRTVAGKGFYEREEVNDLLQLLKFLDNTTDELSLASVLRSQICSISDNALLSLRCAPLKKGIVGPGLDSRGVRPLFTALVNFESIDFIDLDEVNTLSSSRDLLKELVENRFRSSISKTLRTAVTESQYLEVVGAQFDGSLRVANVEKLINLAERFTVGGSVTIRDFVRFVDEFIERGGREAEGSIDQSENAVTLMTVHQSKGQEFPIVFLPELHRLQRSKSESLIFDRRHGLTLGVPDGRGSRFFGKAFHDARSRTALRERFESMRLLYVAATRAQEMLILTGSTTDLSKMAEPTNNWLGWIWKAVSGDRQFFGSEIIEIDDVKVRFEVTSPLSAEFAVTSDDDDDTSTPIELIEDDGRSIESLFPLLQRLPATNSGSTQQFNVTDLVHLNLCPRQYYFERVLGSESGKPSQKLNFEDDSTPVSVAAILKGKIIHRFCETYKSGDDIGSVLNSSFEYVVSHQPAEFEEHLSGVDREKVLNTLGKLAGNYASSETFQRIEAARLKLSKPDGNLGVFSERSFVLRRTLGLLKGTIDKLIVLPAATGEGLEVEIIDFKTNRIDQGSSTHKIDDSSQLSLFDEPSSQIEIDLTEDPIQPIAETYRFQMQCYALAAKLLIPDIRRIKATLHFLDVDREYAVADEYLDKADIDVDKVMALLHQKVGFSDFEPKTGTQCKRCAFRDACPQGQIAIAKISESGDAGEDLHEVNL